MAKTLNGKLIEEGFSPLTVIQNKRLPERLSEILVELLKGPYEDIRIIPGEIALAGSIWQLKDPSHIVYVKDKRAKRDHPVYKLGGLHYVTANFVCTTSAISENAEQRLAVHDIE